MPKRKRNKEDEDRWRRKIQKYKKKLGENPRKNVIYSDDDSDVQNEEHPNEDQNDDLHIVETDYPLDNLDRMSLDSTVFFSKLVGNNAYDDTAQSSPKVQPSPEVLPPPQEIDPVLLEALGETQSDDPEWGDEIHVSVAERWEPLFKTGLRTQTKEELFKKYLYPKNLPSSKPPLLNQELHSVITAVNKNRDIRLATKQGQLGHAMSAIGRAMTGILTKKMETPDILKTLNNAAKLIADYHYVETNTRRLLIMPSIDKSYLTPLKDRTRDSFLFGEGLGDFIKSSQGLKKTGQLIAPPPVPARTATSPNLNWRGPSSSRWQQQHNRAPAYTRGVQRTAQAPPARRARTSMSPPPPPPARHNYYNTSRRQQGSRRPMT